MNEYTYKCEEYYDELYNVRMVMDRLTELLQSSKTIKQADRGYLLEALTIISKLEKR